MPHEILPTWVWVTCEYDGIVSFLSCGKCDRIVNPARLEEEGWHIMGREQWHGMAGSSGWSLTWGPQSYNYKELNSDSDHMRHETQWLAQGHTASVLRLSSMLIWSMPSWVLRWHLRPMVKLKRQYFGHLMWRADPLEKTLMLEMIQGKRRGQQRRWLDGITNSMDMTLSQLWEIVKDKEALRPAIHGITKCQTWLSEWTTTIGIIRASLLAQW